MANLTEEELKIITDLQKEFVEKKVQLGDAVIVQHNLMSDVNILRAKFSQEEQKLIKVWSSPNLSKIILKESNIFLNYASEKNQGFKKRINNADWIENSPCIKFKRAIRGHKT